MLRGDARGAAFSQVAGGLWGSRERVAPPPLRVSLPVNIGFLLAGGGGGAEAAAGVCGPCMHCTLYIPAC